MALTAREKMLASDSQHGAAELRRRIVDVRAREAGGSAGAGGGESSDGGNLLTGLTEDALLLRIGSFLTSSLDLVRLGRVCTRFATKCVALPAVAEAAAAVVVAAAARLHGFNGPAPLASTGQRQQTMRTDASAGPGSACSHFMCLRWQRLRQSWQRELMLNSAIAGRCCAVLCLLFIRLAPLATGNSATSYRVRR